MYFSFKESVSNAHCFGVFSFYNVSRKGGAGMDGDCDERLLLDSSSFMDEDVYSCQGHRLQAENTSVFLDSFNVKKVFIFEATRKPTKSP